jgi:hypothetical protein
MEPADHDGTLPLAPRPAPFMHSSDNFRMALLINHVVRAPVRDFEPAGAVETGVGTLEKAVAERRLDVLVSFGTG